MANIHESHKTCVICGKDFESNRPTNITCSVLCSIKRKAEMDAKNYREHRIMKKWSEKNKCKK